MRYILKRDNLQDINTTVTKNFNENIEYIQENHPKLFEKLSALDAAVSNGHYQEKYELLYENSSFDVYENSTNNYLYNKKITTHTKKSLQSVDFSIENNCFEGFIRQSYSKERVALFEKKKKDTPLKFYASYVADILHETEQDEIRELRTIDKYIFFGVGLGEHIDAIVKKVSAKVYLIVEDDLELFRLSLFCTNYKEISKNAKLFFSVFEDDTEFSKTAQTFLQKSYFYNHYIKYFQLLSHSEDKANKFYVAISTQSDLKFLFHDYLQINISPIERLSQNYNILLKSLSFQEKTFSDKPFLFLASGPSLQKNIEFVKKNKNCFIIVAVSSTLNLLEMHNIKPHILIHLDPFDASLKSFENLRNISFLDDTLLVLAASSPKKLFTMLKKENIFIYEAGSNYKDDAFNISAPCIGSLGYMFLLALKSSKIYLLGLDLSVDSTTGLDHADTHQDTKRLTLEDVFSNKETLSYKDDLFEIKGNFREKIYTTPHFYSSISVINRYFPTLIKSFQEIYNMSDGALFSQTTPLYADKVIAYPKLAKDINRKLKNLFISHSTDKLSAQDKNSLKQKLSYAYSISKDIQNYSLVSANATEYAQDIVDIIIKDNSLQKYELARVLDSYLYYILNFIYNYMQNSHHSLKQLKKVDKLLRNQLITLISYYIKALEIALEKKN